MAPAQVLQGAVRLHGLASSQTPDTQVRDAVGIPEDRDIVCGISLGYADPAHPANAFRTERADVGEAVSGLA